MLISYGNLPDADLVVDATYGSDLNSAALASEPLGPLTGASNQGGFRFSGSIESPELVVLYTTMAETDWPDSIDRKTASSTTTVIIGDQVSSFIGRAGRGGN